MRNANLLLSSSPVTYGDCEQNPRSKPSSFVFCNEDHVLTAVREGNVELDSIVDNDYYWLTPAERANVFETVSKGFFARHKSADLPLFKARFNPNNQYQIKTVYCGKEKTYECFMFEGRFHTGAQLFLKEVYITEVIRIGENES